MKKLIDTEIDDFYSHTSEQTRLQMGLGPLEFERNKELITRFLPKEKGVIVDVGGGPGIYAEWLAKKDHHVYLIDPVAKHIKQARARAEKIKKNLQCIQGESRHIDIPDGIADMVILHGPLYHLQQEKDRIDCIQETKRILKPHGIALGFAINYTASTLVALTQGIMHEPGVYGMCVQELTTGLHQAPENMSGILPKAFYHRPEQLKGEFEQVGFKDMGLYSVEGMVWLDRNYFESRSDPFKKQTMMELLRITEKDMNTMAFSPHIMIAVKK